MQSKESIETIFFANQQEWEAWLHEQESISPGVWLKLAKKETGIPSITYAEALEGALCYGWIDGQKAALDNQYWLQKFTPRRPKSIWSKVNCAKAMQLIADGRMRPAGQLQVDRAKADGRWEQAYASQSQITIPEDFQRELDKYPGARAFFSTLDSKNRYAMLFRIQSAQKAETRSARIEKFIAMLEKQEKIYP